MPCCPTLLIKIKLELIPTAKEFSACAAINRCVVLKVFWDFQIDRTARLAIQPMIQALRDATMMFARYGRNARHQRFLITCC